MAELTDAQVAQEEEFLKGLPRFNLAAFLIPPIWGPAHGFWVTILFYPAWILVDNVIYHSIEAPTWLSILIAVLSAVSIVGVSVIFSIVSQPIAAHRAEAKGVSRDKYLSRQRIWAWVSIGVAVIMVALATWYNISFRPES